jgi:hypothetical protein
MADEEVISWMALEEGTEVVAADGESVGKVAKVIADVQKDIFSGITFRTGLLSTQRFAPAALVETITPQAVRLSVSSTEADELEDYAG